MGFPGLGRGGQALGVPGVRHHPHLHGGGRGGPEPAGRDRLIGDGPAALTGRAAKGVARLLHQHGFEVVAEPESFLVTKQDRLEPQEQDRARDWAAKLAAGITPG